MNFYIGDDMGIVIGGGISYGQHAAITHTLSQIPSPLTGKICTRINAGIEASRPAGVNAGDFYWATDTAKLWAYDGTEWQDCKPLGVIINDAERTTTSEVLVKKKETQLKTATPILIVEFEIYRQGGIHTTYAQVYRNGEAAGTMQNWGTDSWEFFSEEIAGWSADDYIQIYLRISNEASTAKVRNFRVTAVNPIESIVGVNTSDY